MAIDSPKQSSLYAMLQESTEHLLRSIAHQNKCTTQVDWFVTGTGAFHAAHAWAVSSPQRTCRIFLLHVSNFQDLVRGSHWYQSCVWLSEAQDWVPRKMWHHVSRPLWALPEPLKTNTQEIALRWAYLSFTAVQIVKIQVPSLDEDIKVLCIRMQCAHLHEAGLLQASLVCINFEPEFTARMVFLPQKRPALRIATPHQLHWQPDIALSTCNLSTLPFWI